ncbi:hypothetical protein C0J52_19960 [Blattella germanica]|nr:hypothetical protein C0J52_19960 [Blattella germanica]
MVTTVCTNINYNYLLFQRKICCLSIISSIIIFIIFIQQSTKSLLNQNYHQQYVQLVKMKPEISTTTVSTPQQEEFQTNARPPDVRTFKVDFHLGRWDRKRLYKFFDFVLPGDRFSELSEKYSICLATQSSIERLDSLVQVVNRWPGTISVSVFIAGNEYALLEFYVSYLRQCFPQIRERVSFHLAYSPAHPPTEDPFNFIISQDCNNPEDVLKELVQYRTQETTNWKQNSTYPQNHLRNHARKNCQTSHVFLTDIDIIPSIGMLESVDVFIKSKPCEKLCAFVVPVYEVDESADFPKHKSEMIELVKAGLARPFHEKIFKPAQTPTDYKRWEKNIENDDVKSVQISHEALYKQWYEPFFVVDDTAPPHDERFIGYGFSRNTQVLEMQTAGYRFFVLSPVFGVHWRLQTLKEDYGDPWRRRQVAMNNKLVRQFKIELKARYQPQIPKKTKLPQSKVNLQESKIPKKSKLPDPKANSQELQKSKQSKLPESSVNLQESQNPKVTPELSLNINLHPI